MVKGTGGKPLSRSLRLYQRLAVAFVVITFFLLVAVLYLSVSRATIHIVPAPQKVSGEAMVEVVKSPTADGQIAGVVLERKESADKFVVLPAEGATPVEEKAGGTVTLINETGNPQTLVATTRLLSPQGALFRIDEGTVVPAHGQVEAIVHADVVGIQGNIGPARFTIPGLGQSLQTSIYAVSVDTMQGGVQYKRVVTETDIANAYTALEGELAERAQKTFNESVDRQIFTGAMYKVTPLKRTASLAAGAEASSFTVSVEVTVQGVFYADDIVLAFAESELLKRVPDGYQLLQTSNAIETTVAEADATAGTATLTLGFEGTAILSEDAASLNKDRFLGRAPNEVTTLLRASEGVEDATITFTPFWLQRIPTLKDHVRIEIEEPHE